jgi:hypothetical protein
MSSEPKFPSFRLVLGGLAIACGLIILFQNLQPLVTIAFLGRSTIPIPLSFAVLGAFVTGAIAAFIINLVVFWLNPRPVEDRDDFEDRENRDGDRTFNKSNNKSDRSSKSADRKSPTKPDFEEDEDIYDGDREEDDDDYREVIDVKYTDR